MHPYERNATICRICQCEEDRAYLHGVTSTVDAVFGAVRAVAGTPMKLHFLCLESSRQACSPNKVFILQHDRHWEKKEQRHKRETEQRNNEWSDIAEKLLQHTQ